MIRIAIVDDHTLFRQGLASVIGLFEGMEVAFQAANGREMIAQLEHDTPDIVLMDLEMPEMDGRQAIQHLHQHCPEIRTIVLSMHNDDYHVLELLEKGVRAYLFKDSEAAEMETAIRAVAESGYYFNAHISLVMVKQLSGREPVIQADKGPDPLTERETEVLVLICQELTNAEIAEQLHLSRRTVDGHRNRILQKTGARNTVGLVRYAIKQGLIEP